MPLNLFARWYEEAQHYGLREPTSMVLATASRDGKPSARVVLLKSFDARGFCFFTNAESHKGEQLTENPQAALCFYWTPPTDQAGRQVRVEGTVERVSDAEADAYFQSRPRESRIGARASQQSRPLKDRAELEAALARETARWEGKEVARPAHWTGFRLVPQTIEFWEERPFRLHHRALWTRDEHGVWTSQLLYP